MVVMGVSAFTIDDQGQSDKMLDMTIAVDYDDSARKLGRHRCRFSSHTAKKL
jgi:hypothetical protein